VAENNADIKLKGRGAIASRNGVRKNPDVLSRGDKHWTRQKPEKTLKGSRHGGAVLNEGLVVEICCRYQSEEITIKDLAREYNVSKTTLGRIVRGVSWKHVNAPRSPANHSSGSRKLINTVSATKLTIEQVNQARSLYTTGEFSYKTISDVS